MKLDELERVSKLEEVEDNVYYLYPSHAESIALVLSGEEIKRLVENDFSLEEVFAVVQSAAARTFLLLGLTFAKDVIREVQDNWDKELHVDTLVMIAYILHGYPLKVIKYGYEESELHRLLNDKLVCD